MTRQWLDPDKEFKEFEQPNVPTIQSTLEASAAQALQKGKLENAAQQYQQLLGQHKLSDVDKLRYQTNIADITRKLRRLDQALSLYEDILARQPGYIDALEGKGLTLMALGRVPESGEIFKQVLQQNPKRWRALNALGILFASKGLNTEALTYYSEALKASPNNAGVLNNVGLTYAIAHDYPSATTTLKHAAANAKSEARRKHIELNLALVYGITGHYNDAKRIAKKHLKGPALDNNLGLYAHLANDEELAKTYLNRALTGSAIHYERAWKNLDIISGEGG
jgi:Flp pilus assembly protein TadD